MVNAPESNRRRASSPPVRPCPAAHDAAGLSIIEVIIAMLLLGVIAVAILPALWQGVMYSSQQASTATATRFLNSLVEEAREDPDCVTTIPGVIGRTQTDGQGITLTSTGTLTDCTSGSAAKLVMAIVADGRTLASTTARIYIP